MPILLPSTRPPWLPPGYDVRQPGSSGGEFGWLSLQEEPGKYNETTFQVSQCRGCMPGWAMPHTARKHLPNCSQTSRGLRDTRRAPCHIEVPFLLVRGLVPLPA